jgi:two-component system chemotaxis sensor kinase CheA
MVAPLEGGGVPATESPPEDRVSILLVDDQPANLGALEATLESTGCRFVLAKSADEALLALLNEDFAAIVLDIRMPGMSGFELAEVVRKDERTSKMPIIALSALTSPESIERGRQVGFHDYIAKFDRPGLLAALKEQAAMMGEAA